MAEVIKMPRLSDTMEEGVVATWLKKVGDKVEEGEILAEIETDKATMEFESFYDGILSHIAVQAGETVNVDELIAIISEGEIDVTKALENYSKEPIEPSTETKSDVETNEEETSSVEVDVIPEVSISDKRIFASPLAKKIANE